MTGKWLAATMLVVSVLAQSCVMVDDFGTYWESGTVDPAAEGTWRKVPVPGTALDASPGPPTVTFARDGASYAIRNSEGSWVVRSVRIAQHPFFMIRGAGKPEGMLQRYEIQDNLLRLYWPDPDAMMTFLQAKHPGARNITPRRGIERYVLVRTLDAEAFAMLSGLPDDASLWKLVAQYLK